MKYKNFMDSYRPISFRKKQTKREELDALVTDIRLLEKESRLFLGEFEKVSNYYPVTDQFKREEEFCRDLCSKTYSWKEDKDNTPEDGHDHMVNSVQYAWIPYQGKIYKR